MVLVVKLGFAATRTSKTKSQHMVHDLILILAFTCAATSFGHSYIQLFVVAELDGAASCTSPIC